MEKPLLKNPTHSLFWSSTANARISFSGISELSAWNTCQEVPSYLHKPQSVPTHVVPLVPCPMALTVLLGRPAVDMSNTSHDWPNTDEEPNSRNKQATPFILTNRISMDRAVYQAFIAQPLSDGRLLPYLSGRSRCMPLLQIQKNPMVNENFPQ